MGLCCADVGRLVQVLALAFWERRLVEYHAEQRRLDETRAEREAEAARLAREEEALGWKRSILANKSGDS